MTSFIGRIVKQMLHDKRSLGLVLFVPLLLLTLLYLLLSKSDYIPTVAADHLPTAFYNQLSQQSGIKLIEKTETQSASDYLKDKNADAVLSQDASGIHLMMLEPAAAKLSPINDAIKAVSAKMNPSAQMNISFVYGSSGESDFDSLGYFLLSVLSFFLIFVISGISFVRERTSNTLERMMRAPVRTVSIVSGYIMGFGVFAVIQSIITILYSKFVLKLPFLGPWWLASLFMLMIAVIAVMLGILVSVLSKNEFQVVQFIPVIIIPQMFFSGLIPVDTLPYHLNYLSYIMPLYYGSFGMKQVLVYGDSLNGAYPYLLALLAYIVVLFAANIAAVRKYRMS